MGSNSQEAYHCRAASSLACTHQGAYAGDVGRLRGAQQGILEQCLSRSLALVGLIDGQSGQNHHRHRMAGQSLCDAQGCGLWIDAADGQAVEADHCATAAAYIGLRTVGLLVSQGITLQKLVQRGLTTIKRIDRVCRMKFADRLQARSA